jgi:hypothetical protein
MEAAWQAIKTEPRNEGPGGPRPPGSEAGSPDSTRR